jgi:uncharacterized membrane protein YfcA
MAVAVALGLLIGLALGALGGGGSILAVPVLVHLAGLEPKAATAVSLVAVGAAALVGAVNHGRAGRVRWGAAAAFIAMGVPGSWLGSHINKGIDGNVLLLGFSVLTLIAAWRMLTACPSCTRVGEERAEAEAAAAAEVAVAAGAAGAGSGVAAAGAEGAADELVASEPVGAAVVQQAAGWVAQVARVARVALAGLVVGFLTGLFGVGGGFVIVPALTLALGLFMPIAIATSLAVIVGNAGVALAFRGLGAVDWGVAGPFAATMLVGSLIGSQVAHRLPAQKALNAFAALLVAVAVANGIAAAVALAA